MTKRNTSLVIGIAGGTGSGKTTIANYILETVGHEKIAFLPHDAYYRDLSDLSREERAQVNFDHPSSLDTELLIEHVQNLRKGDTIQLPSYDFKTHTRTQATIPIKSQPIILIEGILIFAEPELRKLFDLKIYVDTDADIRFIRRLKRDIDERGRTTQSVINQYLDTVRPMHLEFVEPSKRYASVIIPEGGYNHVALDLIVARIESMLQE
ncbi:MAG: uridine kinase [Anaerolineales bacterium]|nr:uridine kinase [Anaerolineales bacterium]